jgi:hypothetical protein
MALWFAHARYLSRDGQQAQSDWVIEAQTEAQAQSILRSSLIKDGRSLIDAQIAPLDLGQQNQADLAQGVGISTVLRESTAGTSQSGTTGVQIRPAYRASDDTPDEALRWIAPQLWHALFAQQGTGRVYALIEAARWMGADDDIARALTQADVPGVCLFDLDEDSPLAPYAPWLIDVTLAHQDNTDPPSDIHRTLFATLANAGQCTFLRADSDLVAMRQALRKLTRLRDLDDKWYYCRFWEPEFFLYFILFLENRQLLSPLESLRGFTVIIEGEIASADTALAACALAPPDRAGDLALVFDAGTAMVSLAHARQLERKFKRGCAPRQVYRLARTRLSLRGMDYAVVRKCTDIAYAIHAHYGADAAKMLNDRIVARCAPAQAGAAIFLEVLHGQCMFSLVHDIKPHLLRSEVEF